MKLKTGDTVLIISGKDKGKKGKIIEAFPKEGRIIVEGANLRKKHQKPRKQGEKGQIMTLSVPMSIANVKLICLKCGKATRTGYDWQGPDKKQKVRICKKCGQTL